MLNRITRTLAYEDAQQERKVINQDEIPAIIEPVVILGDPGLGKSVLTQMLSERPGMKYCRAGSFTRSAKPESLIAQGERIIVDGLDEIASTALGGGVEAVLIQLSAMDNPPFILSCREADWRGAADRIKIEDDYGAAPVLLHLQPFEHRDALAFLSNEFPAIDAARVLDNLASRGLDDIYKNPLTLRLLGEVAQEPGALPNSRAELLDRACRVMLKEKNPRHLDATHVQRSDEELLLAAGTMCATQLLCDRIGVFTGAYAETPVGFVHIADVTNLPFGEAANDALKTRLFQAEGEGRFTHVHRVVAEYLGAKWLASCFDAGLSQRRIFGLFRQGEGVPTSLRGLHAWIGHFSDVLAGRCIAADPYAVLQYGDAETLGLEQARALLTALAKLSEGDPYFRSEDWGQHPASGLIRAELKDEILAIISTPRRHTQLTTILIDTVVGTDLAKELAPSLKAMMFDQDRVFVERSGATDALRTAGIVVDWKLVIHRLLEMGDANSTRLAVEILNDLGLHTVSIQTSVEAILARLGLTVSQIPKSNSQRDHLVRLGDTLFEGLDAGQLGLLLDNLSTYARPLMPEAYHNSRAQVADLVRHLVAQALAGDPTITPERVWTWIGWIDGDDGYSDLRKKRLTDIFRSDPALRAGLLEYVLLTPCETDTWMAGFRLADTHLGLYPTDEDLVGVLKALVSRSGDGVMDVDVWRDILRLGRSQEGIADIVYDAAIEFADGRQELLDVLSEMSEVVVPQWKIKEAERKARAEAIRQAKWQLIRDELTERAFDVAAGNFRDLGMAADLYFRGSNGLNHSLSPQARLREFLGCSLAEQVLAGFIAVLGRGDLPSAAEVVEIHCKGGNHVAETPMICGVAEMIRRGEPVDVINPTTLEVVLMAWHRASGSWREDHVNIGDTLEAVLFTSEHNPEKHFRASIEPQLACGIDHPDELYRLTHDARWAVLAGRLAIDWLRTYPALPAYTQEELIICALKAAAPESLRTLVVEMLSSVHQDCETKLSWLSAGYIVDFDNNLGFLWEAAAENPGFLWFIRNRVKSVSGDNPWGFTIAQLVYILEAFGAHWPNIERPSGTTSGDTNPWDASVFIERVIYAIANNPSPEATEALRALIDGHAPSYGDTMRHALSLQQRVRRDNEYVAPSVRQLQAVMANTLPETIDDMRDYFGDRIEAVQERMHGSNTDMWEAYWANTQPKRENFCRNRLVEHISGQLPSSIRFEPEMHMPRQKRADIAAIRNSIGLPVEIKGQWHGDVWNAPVDQLDAKYTRDWHAEGRGVYIVMWFGNVPGKQLPRHPEGLDRPNTPEALRQMLIDRIPEARRSQIDVFVVDVSRPTNTA